MNRTGRRKWWRVVLACVLGAILVATMSAYTPPKRQSTTDKGGGGTSEGVPATAVPACRHFIAEGWSHAQASGMVGNFWEESGLRPDDPNDAAKGGGGGIAQWEGDRWNNPDYPRTGTPGLLQFAASRRTAWSDLDTQLAFVDLELRTTHKGAADHLRRLDDPADAASAFMRDYEGPSDPHEDVRRSDARQIAGSACK